MQRLFTTFADGWPGYGLLIQRSMTAIILLHNGIAMLKESPASAIPAPQIIAAVLAIFLLIGLWTPVAGALTAAVEVWIAFGYPTFAMTAILLAMLSATLAMIGPGAFSIDARLFGRKHIGS